MGEMQPFTDILDTERLQQYIPIDVPDIYELYLHRLLFTLGMNSVAVFIPLYLHQLGFTPVEIILFFIFHMGAPLLIAWQAAAFIARIGYKRAAFAVSPAILLFYVLLTTTTAAPLMYLVGLLGGVAFTVYWLSMNSLMAARSSGEDRHRQVGYFNMMPLLAGVAAPLLGGGIAELFGFKAMLLSAAAMIAASFGPFLFSADHFEQHEIRYRPRIRREPKEDFWTLVAEGMTNTASMVIWPLYLGIVVTGVLNVGGAGSLMALGGAAVSLFLGRYARDRNLHTILVVSAVVLTGTWLVMSQVTTTAYALLFSLINSLAANAVAFPIFSTALEHAQREHFLEYFAFREVALIIGRGLTMALFIAVFYLFPVRTAFVIAFIATAVAALLLAAIGRSMVP